MLCAIWLWMNLLFRKLMWSKTFCTAVDNELKGLGCREISLKTGIWIVNACEQQRSHIVFTAITKGCNIILWYNFPWDSLAHLMPHFLLKRGYFIVWEFVVTHLPLDNIGSLFQIALCATCMFSLCRRNMGKMNIAWVHSFVECCSNMCYYHFVYSIQSLVFNCLSRKNSDISIVMMLFHILYWLQLP